MFSTRAAKCERYKVIEPFHNEDWQHLDHSREMTPLALDRRVGYRDVANISCALGEFS